MGNDEPHPEAQQPQHVQDVQAQQVQAVGRAELWIAICMLVVAIIGTGVGVSTLVLTLHGEIRADLRDVQDRIDLLDGRVRDVEIAIAGGGQQQAGGGGSPTVTPPGGD